MHIQNIHLEAFEERFNALVEEWKKSQDESEEAGRESRVLMVDAQVALVHIGAELHRDLQKLAPFGQGNREPILVARSVAVHSVRTLGKNLEHLKLGLQTGSKILDAIGFNLAKEHGALVPGMSIDVAFTLDQNVWNGNTSLQLKIVDMKSV